MSHKIFRWFTSLILALAIMFARLAPALAAAGALDPTFGTDGKVTTAFNNFDFGNAVAVQSDGKIIVAGFSSRNSDFALARYSTDGSLDTTFDTDGKVITDFGSSSSDLGYAVAVQSDGKIVVAGYSSSGNNNDFALARYNSDGSLDTTFDTDGKVITDFASSEDQGYAVALQSDGKIVVAGYSNNGNTFDFALARYNGNGSLDTTFDTDGKVTTLFENGSSNFDSAVAVQSDGKIVVVGNSINGITLDFALARYNSNGSLDTTFDTDGKMTTDFGSFANDVGNAIALQPDGKIVVAGGSAHDFALARYNSDGSLDTTFDTDGKVTTDFASSQDGGYAVALQSDGKIVVAGNSTNSNSDFALARYNSDGSLDTTFDTDGKVTTDFGTIDFGFALALQSDGKIVVAGRSGVTDTSIFALARYDVANSSSTEVTIDIKPGNKHNRIMIGSGGSASVQVAILSTPDFDAPRQVDKNSLTFGATGDENSLRHRFLIRKPDCRARDVNDDRLRDLVCSFLIGKTGFKIGDTVGILKGKTVDDTLLEGRDSVVITAPSYPSYPSYP